MRGTIHAEGLMCDAALRERCRALGLPAWKCDSSGAFTVEPQFEGAAGAWLRSPFVGKIVGAQVQRWADEEEQAVVQAFPGCWLIPIIENRRRRRRSFTVVMCIGVEALNSEQFDAACQSARLDRSATRNAVRKIATHSEASVERMTLVLNWTHADLESLDQHESTVEGFSRQLSESYEGISLLYSLGQSMNQLVHPQNFVRQACEELKATLSFSWVAVKFLNSNRDARSMAGRLFFAGDLPCKQSEFDAQIATLLAGMSGGAGRVIQPSEAGAMIGRGSPILAHPVLRNGLIVGAYFAGDKMGDDPQVSSVDMKLLDAAGGYTGIVLDNACLYDDQQLMFVGTLEALTAAIDAKDPYTCGHSQRVSHVAALLAAAHGLDEEQLERIRIAGLVHDVGKIGVPESVLRKSGKLTDEEFRIIQTHPEIGHRILRDIPALEDVLPGVLYHHERFDGRGYPKGLSGRNIPLVARIIGLADAFDAMSSTRTYRAAMPRERVLAEINANAGVQFDPDLVASFKLVDLSQYDELVGRHMAARGGEESRGMAA
jgi:HD-GYP domain-containing protein (c-di-GMP phosphodiesterase class II)